MAESSVVPKFVNAALADLRRHDRMRLPIREMPVEMQDISVPPHGDWIAWKPVRSTVDDEALNEIERAIGLPLPTPYRQLLKIVHFYELTEVGVRFTPHPVHTWRSELTRLYQSWIPERIIGRGLVPFGDEVFMDAGPVCFDTRHRLPDGDCPVVFWDHDWVNSEQEIVLMFSSSAKMFECLYIVAEAGVNFCYHDPANDHPEALPEKRRLMTRFLATDPEGAGRLARGYWTSWGVNPPD